MIQCPVTKVMCSREITLKPLADRWYSVQGHFDIDCYLRDSGVKHISVDDGFLFDGRSGGPIVDFIAPNLGTQDELLAWLLHDLNGHSVTGFSFEETNAILYWMLRKYCGYGYLRAQAIHTAVSMSDSWYGEPAMGDRSYPNLSRIKVRHYPTIQAP